MADARDESIVYDRSFLENTGENALGIKTVWEYARYRLSGLCRSASARLEFGIGALLLALLFGPALLSWWRRWTLAGSLQNYAAFVPFLTLGWLWLNRLRIVLPELDSLNERFTERSVLRFLTEEEPEPPKRLLFPLVLGCLLTPFALRLGDPTFTCLGFLTLLVGIVGYRFGTQALRVGAFPLAFLTLMVPLPGMLLDFVGRRMQSVELKIVRNLMHIFGFNAEIAAEGNPVIMLGQPRYELYAGYVGTGFAEAGFVLIVTLCYLSLLEAPFRSKLAGMLFATLWTATLVVLRLCLIAIVGHFADSEVVAILVPVSRWLLPVVALAGQFFILRGLKCRQFHEWVCV